MTRLLVVAVTLLGGLIPVVSNRKASAVDAVVVCPTSFQATFQTWIDHRRSEGMQVQLLPSRPDAATLQREIREAADQHTRYVVLVGDAPVIGTACDATRQTPIMYAPTRVTAAWGSTPTLSSDLLYGDFDLDHLPEAVVGRLPVDSNAQLKTLIERIIARDDSDDFGRWRSNVQLVGGVGGFGAMIDGAIESVTRTIVTGLLPTATRTSVTYASPGHPFFPRNQPFTDAVLDRYREGARFFVYAGHGQVTELDRVPSDLGPVPVLDRDSVQRLDRPAGESPIALMLACYTGALDAAEDSIAEEMVLREGGPIAVLAGSRVTMPYGNTTAAVGLINGVFTKRLPRLGDAWLSALQEMHTEVVRDQSPSRVMIDALASLVSPSGSNLVDERREHMLLYNLLGDPTLRLHHPAEIELKVPAGHERGKPLEVEINSPVAGSLQITVDRPLGSLAAEETTDPNDLTVCASETRVDAKTPVTSQVDLPADLRGPVIIRATVAGQKQWATGAARTILR